MTQKMATRTMNDVAQRLRDWRSVHLTKVGVLCDDAAAEIERLQKVIDDYVYIAQASAREIKQLRQSYEQTDDKRGDSNTAWVTLTDAERSAIADAADRYAEITPESAETASTLRGLLERLK